LQIENWKLKIAVGIVERPFAENVNKDVFLAGMSMSPELQNRER